MESPSNIFFIVSFAKTKQLLENLRNVALDEHILVSRNIYGGEKHFRNTSFGLEVYKLANELDIEPLVQDLDTFFMESKASDKFPIFDLYLRLNGNPLVIGRCIEVNICL